MSLGSEQGRLKHLLSPQRIRTDCAFHRTMGAWNTQMLSPSAGDNAQLTERGSRGHSSSVSRVGDVGIVNPQRANFSAIER